MSYQKKVCYRSKCVHKCNNPETKDREAKRLSSVLAGLKKASAEKQLILDEIFRLQNEFNMHLSSKEATVIQYTTKLDLDSQTLNKLYEQVQTLRQKKQANEGAMAQLLKELAGLDKLFEQKSGELRRLQVQQNQGRRMNSAIEFQNRNLQDGLTLTKDQAFALGKEEQALGRSLTDNFTVLCNQEKQIIHCKADHCKMVKTLETAVADNESLKTEAAAKGFTSKHEGVLNEFGLRIEQGRMRLATLQQMCHETSGQLNNQRFSINQERKRGQALQQQRLQLEAAVQMAEAKLAALTNGQVASRMLALKQRNEQLRSDLQLTRQVTFQTEEMTRALLMQTDQLLRQNTAIKQNLQRKRALGKTLLGF